MKVPISPATNSIQLVLMVINDRLAENRAGFFLLLTAVAGIVAGRPAMSQSWPGHDGGRCGESTAWKQVGVRTASELNPARDSLVWTALAGPHPVSADEPARRKTASAMFPPVLTARAGECGEIRLGQGSL